MEYSSYIQRCSMAKFYDMLGDFAEVFTDDLFAFGNSIEMCLQNLEKVLARYEKTNLVLN